MGPSGSALLCSRCDGVVSFPVPSSKLLRQTFKIPECSKIRPTGLCMMGGRLSVASVSSMFSQPDGRVAAAPLDSTAFESDGCADKYYLGVYCIAQFHYFRLLASFRPKSDTYAMSCLRNNFPPIQVGSSEDGFFFPIPPFCCGTKWL